MRERAFQIIRLEREHVAAFAYRRWACQVTYRMIMVRKKLAVQKGQQRLLDDYRYFFYLTNDREPTPAELVFRANDRGNQQNLHAQSKVGVRALQGPVDTLETNWAYIVVVAVASNLKGGLALCPQGSSGRGVVRHRLEKRTVLPMEFKTFLNAFLRMPWQIVQSGRRLFYPLANWDLWQGLFSRVFDQLRC